MLKAILDDHPLGTGIAPFVLEYLKDAEVGLEVRGEVLDEDDALEVLRQVADAELVGLRALGHARLGLGHHAARRV